MDSAKIGLITTLLLGIFILIGSLIAFLTKKKDRVVDFSIGLALGVVAMLMITDLLPEIIEHLGFRYIYLFVIFCLLGYGILKILDHFIPDHDDSKLTEKEKKENLIHIGLITSLALILHNIIEGMAVYSTVISSANLGVAVTLGIGFHNIPLGMVIASAFYQSNQNIWKTISVISAVSLSTFFGGLIMFFSGVTAIGSSVLGALLSLTLGMLIYITIGELIPRIGEAKDRKVSYIGILMGIVILLIAMAV